MNRLYTMSLIGVTLAVTASQIVVTPPAESRGNLRPYKPQIRSISVTPTAPGVATITVSLVGRVDKGTSPVKRTDVQAGGKTCRVNRTTGICSMTGVPLASLKDLRATSMNANGKGYPAYVRLNPSTRYWSRETGSCTIAGTARADRLVGTPGNDRICGLGGDDVISGGGGNDTLLGGPGRDSLWGGMAPEPRNRARGLDEQAEVEDGDDTLEGQDGDDLLNGGTGTNICIGGTEWWTSDDLLDAETCGDVSGPFVLVDDPGIIEIDTSTSSKRVELRMRIRDDLSGVAQVNASYWASLTPNGTLAKLYPDLKFKQYVQGTVARQSGDDLDATYVATFEFPRYVAPETFRLYFEVRDSMGNLNDDFWFDVGGRQVKSFEAYRPVFQTSDPRDGFDVSAPTISDLAVSPTSVNTDAAPATITATFRLEDRPAGVGGAVVCWASAGCVEAQRVEGTTTQGSYRAVLTVPRHSYPVSDEQVSVRLWDRVGNSGRNGGMVSAHMGPGVTQLGDGDREGPTCSDSVFEPSSVKLGGADRDVTVSATLADDFGVVSARMTLIPPQGVWWSDFVTWTPLTRISGDALSGVYEGRVTISRFARPGRWLIWGDVRDEARTNSQFDCPIGELVVER